jgi:hypothetical protein
MESVFVTSPSANESVPTLSGRVKSVVVFNRNLPEGNSAVEETLTVTCTVPEADTNR